MALIHGRRALQSGSMRGAAVIQFASKYASIGVQLVVTAVLSRLVTPDEYGLMAIVNVFTALFALFTDMGLGVAIVQFRDLEERDFGALFAFSVILGTGLAVAFCFLAVPVSWFYGHDELVGLCLAAAPSILFSCMNMVPNGLMLREKRFMGIGVRLVTCNLVAGVVAIALAFSGWGAYALVAQVVLSALLVLVWNLFARPLHEVSLGFGSTLSKVSSYSANQFAFNFLNYFARNLDNLVIGRVLGSQSLAYYDKAYKLTTYPLSALSSVVASVVQPFMAEHQDEQDVLRACWWKVTKLLSLVGAPIAAVLFCCAEEVTLLFYGDQWGAAAPLLQVLSLSVYVQIIGNPSGAFYQSAGRTDSMFKAGLVNTVLTVTGLAVGLSLGGLQGAALGISLAYCCHLFAMYYFLLKQILGVKPRELLALLPEVAAAIAACVICAVASSLLGNLELIESFVIKFALTAAVMLAVYIPAGQLKRLKELLGR